MSTILTATEDQKHAVLRRAVILSYATQRFAENAIKLTAKQAVDIDAAMTAMQAALTAVGVGGAALTPTQAIVNNGATFTGTGTGNKVKITVVNSKITAVTLSE